MKKYAGLGSYEFSDTVIKSDDKAIGNIRIWYPKELESDSEKYPLILVANVSNTAALNYAPFCSRLALWEFIVIENNYRQCGTGESMSKTFDYILNLNQDLDSVLPGKVRGAIWKTNGGFIILTAFITSPTLVCSLSAPSHI